MLSNKYCLISKYYEYKYIGIVLLLLCISIIQNSNIAYAVSNELDLHEKLEKNKHQSIIEYFEENPPESIRHLETLIPALYSQASFYSALHEYARLITNDYYHMRDTLSGGFKTPLTSFYQGLLHFYEGNSKKTSYWESFLDNAEETDGLIKVVESLIQEDNISELTSPSIIHQMKQGGSIQMPESCSWNDEVTNARCQFLKDIALIKQGNVMKTNDFFQEVPFHIASEDDFTEITFHDPSDWFLLARYRLEQIYHLMLNHSALRNDVIMLEIAWSTSRYEKIKTLIDEATPNPFHPVFLSAASYKLKGQDQYLEQLLSFTDYDNTMVRSYAIRLISDFDLDDKQVERVLERINSLPKSGLNATRLIARSLINLESYEKALDWLEPVYPRAYHNDLRRINHEKLIMLSQAKYGAGRRYYAEALSHFIALQREYRNMASLLPNLQELVMPDCPECGDMR